MKRIVCYAIGLVFAATHAFAGVVPVTSPFYAGEEQTDARMIYVGGSDSGGRLAIDNHAEFMLARDDSNVAQNWCNAGTLKWSFGFFSCDGPRSEYPQFQADVNGSPAVTFDGKDKFRMILEPGFGYTLPDAITDGKLSVELWVVNPSVAKGEVLIRFEDKQAYDLTCKQFKMKGSKNWQHLVAISDGSKTTFYRDGSLVGTEQKALKFSGEAVINLGAKSLSGSLAALRIHTEPMNAADVSHNTKGGVNLGTYLFYPISKNNLKGEKDSEFWGDPMQNDKLSWHESAHFRSMWLESANPKPDDDIATRVKTKQLPELEAVYTYLNERSGKHLPFVSDDEAKRGDGRKYKWIVGNGWGGSWSGWCPDLALGFGLTYTGHCNPHEYIHGSDSHQMGNITGQWWEAHANFQVAWLGNPQVNPVTNCPKHAHVYPTTGGNYYHSYLIWDHLVETPEFGGIFVTRLWNRGPKAGYGKERTVFPPNGMAEMDPSPETPFSQEWVKMAARNITWDYPSHPEYAKVYATLKYNTRKHYTLLEDVPYLDAGWYEPPKWRTPQQFGYNISPLDVKVGTVTADLRGFVSEAHQSDWSAMFVAVRDGKPRYGNIFTTAAKGSFKVVDGDEELYLVVVATPEVIMPQGIFANDPLCDYRKPGKDRFPYQVKLSGTRPKASLWRPTPGIHGQVDPTAYVSPNAYIGAGAKVLGNARVEDFATVYGTVQDNAVVSGYTTIERNATIRDDARVTDYAIIREGATVENSARVMEHADINRGINISNYAVCKGNAEVSGPVHGTAIIDGNYIKNGDREKGYWFQWSWGDGHHIGELDEEFNQLYLEYQFETQDDYRVWDTYGATWARLINGSTTIKDHGGTVLELDGEDDFVDLHQSVAQFESVSFDLDVKWDGGAKNQALINFSNTATGDAAWLSPSDSQGKLAFSIKVGDTVQVVRATKPLPARSWVNLKLMTFHDTLLIHVNDVEWAKSEKFTLDIEDVNPNECYIGRGAKGNNFGGRIDNLSVWSKSLIDVLPPEPNPATFLLAPMALDGNSVMMQMKLASDHSNPVEYLFEETTGNPGGSDSDWQESSLYYDIGLVPGKTYKYTVRVRDALKNTTKASKPVAITMPRKQPCWFVMDANGTVSMEAENNDGLTTGTVTKQSWVQVKSEKGFSGSGAMQVPDKGKTIDKQYSPDSSPRMDFNVMFTKPGTYFLHVRGRGPNYNGDSCHGGLDMQSLPELKGIGSFPNQPGQYEWMGGKKFEVPHAGLHKINLWMREDGAMIDKIVITTSGQLPKDKGPDESLRGGGDIITLDNDLLRVSLDATGIRKIHDKQIDRTVDLSRDQFSLAVNGNIIESGSIRPTVKKESDTTVAYVYQSDDYTVKVVYELETGWRFVSKQLFLTGPSGKELFIEKIKPFDGQLTHTIAEPVRLNRDRYGVSLRMPDAPGESAAWGCFLLVQNPHTRTETAESSVTLTYEPKMTWKPADGPFRSDRMCIGTFKLTGNTFRADMMPEWRYIQDPDKFLAEGARIDWAEIEAVTDCARAFLLEDRTKSVRVHIGWCENDYQIDFGTDEGKVEYRRIIDQAAAMGCQYVLYTPSHSTLAPLDECRDAWKWESHLMFNLGQKFRKGEWVPGKDVIPTDIKDVLSYAKSKNLKLLAYAYPSLPFMQNPEWTEWLTKQGKTPSGYLTVDTGLRSFQDWYVDSLVAFCNATGCAGYSFDHWWTAYTADLGDVSSIYQQWYGCRRVLENLRKRMPDVIMDGRQQYHSWGTWTWLSGTYPHPMMSDEQPGSFNAIVDLSTERVNGARQRFIAWRLMTRDFCPIEILPGFITHQTQRSDAGRVMRRDHYRTRDWDTLGWKYNLISSVATAPFNHVVNYIPARDSDEFKSFSEEDKAFFRHWLDFTDKNMDVLRHVRPIIGQPMIGRCDGTAAVKDDHGFVFLFNPNYRKMNAEFKLDASIGLEGGQSFLVQQLYPNEGLNIGKPNSGTWRYGDDVSIPMGGTSACVLKIKPIEYPTDVPVLFGASGKATLANGKLVLSGVSGPVGENKDLIVRLGQEARIKTVTVGGQEVPFKQQGKIVNLNVTFAGKPFSQSQQIGDYDPNFNGQVVEGTFAIPKRIFDQLRRRKAEWPVPYTEDDRVAPWVDNSRLLLFAQIAEPYADKKISGEQGSEDRIVRNVPYGKADVVIEINGKPVEVREGYNGVYPYVTRTCMGMYTDISNLSPDTEYHIKVTLPEGLRAGQFQGLFFEHVENEYTNTITD